MVLDQLKKLPHQQRETPHLELMADIVQPFDIVAFQEVADNIGQLSELLSILGSGWDVIYTDVAENQERLGYVFKTNRVQPTGLAAELAMRGYEQARIVIEGIDPKEDPFTGFNRNPYMVPPIEDRKPDSDDWLTFSPASS